MSLPSLLTTFLVIKLTRLWKAAPPPSAVQTLYDVIAGVVHGTLTARPRPRRHRDHHGLAAATSPPSRTHSAWSSRQTTRGRRSYDALRTLTAMVAPAAPPVGNWWLGRSRARRTDGEGQAAGALGVLKAQQPFDDAWLAVAPR